jgi:hypothetical protein
MMAAYLHMSLGSAHWDQTLEHYKKRFLSPVWDVWDIWDGFKFEIKQLSR